MRFGFINIGSYSLIGAFIISAGIYYSNSNSLRSFVPVREVTGTELQLGIFRNGVKIQGTLTRVTFRSLQNTAILHFVSRDMQDVTVLVPMNRSTLEESNLELGQSYTITGTPIGRGTLSLKSINQIEKANPIHQTAHLEELCLRDIVRVTNSTGHALTCDNSKTVNYRSSVDVQSRTTYLGYWTQGVGSQQFTFNIVGQK